MKNKIKNFFQLSSRDKKLFFEAFVTLGMMRFAILTTSFKRLVRELEQNLSEDERENKMLLNDTETATIIAVIRIIRKAAIYSPWKSECLVQSLAAQRLLKRRNLPGTIFLGVMKDTDKNEKMRAHAWTKCGDIFITGRHGHEKFTVVSVFSWSRK